jgi:outer membrane protein assembly factor BamB
LLVAGGKTTDAVLVDPLRHELLRVEGATGRLRWRQVVGEDFAMPVATGKGELLTATQSGRIVSINLETGESPRHVRLPQPVDVSPAVHAVRSLLFAVARQSNVYVLSLADGRCRQVFHLGHSPGAVIVPPVVLGDYLVVAVNQGFQDVTLRVLRIGEGDDPVLKPVEGFSLPGRHIETPLAVHQRRLLMVATDGTSWVFRNQGDEPDGPPQKVAEGGPPPVTSQPRFTLLEGDRYWLANKFLAQYQAKGADSTLVTTTDQDSVFLQPPRVIGQTMFHVRRRPGKPGVLAAAVDLNRHLPIWQTHLAVPLATEPMLDPAGTLTAVTAIGGMYRLGGHWKADAVENQPAPTAEPGKVALHPVRDIIPMPGGMLAMTLGPGSDEIMLYDPLERQKRFRWLPVRGKLSSTALAWQGGLLVPCQDGTVRLLDPQGGDDLATAFRLPGADKPPAAWSAPVLSPKNEAILADAAGHIQRLTVEGRQIKSLASGADETQWTGLPASPVAVLQHVAYALAAGPEGPEVVPLALPDLTAGKGHRFAGKWVWGPRQVGKHHVLLATEEGAPPAAAKRSLLCFDDRQQLLWQAPLPYGPLAGAPLAADGEFFLASANGVVWRIAAATGKEKAKTETGCGLATGPVLLDGRLLVGTRDGCICEVQRP